MVPNRRAAVQSDWAERPGNQRFSHFLRENRRKMEFFSSRLGCGFRFWRSLDVRSKARVSGGGVPSPGTLGSLFQSPKSRAGPSRRPPVPKQSAEFRSAIRACTPRRHVSRPGLMRIVESWAESRHATAGSPLSAPESSQAQYNAASPRSGTRPIRMKIELKLPVKSLIAPAKG